jgi:hypothetical protein
LETPLIIGLLVIAAIWGVYLVPHIFGDRSSASISSTEEFDRWSHSMAHVQKHTAADLAAAHKDRIRIRRRNSVAGLVAFSLIGYVAAWRLSSLAWLLAGLFFTSLIVLYVAMLNEMKQRRLQRLKVTHVSERPTEWEEPQIRVIAN